jgi:acyl-CoA reductase-like NAD-dependent aldehyde dehydrogenase
MDVFYKMFVENEVVILKMNPVNEYLGPFFEEAFKAFVDADFLRVVYGGAEVGDFLCKHADVDNIHITGSDKTHDIIVWGPPGDDQAKRMADGAPLNTKPITSELGNVSPIVVMPGPWKPAEIAFHAANIASQLTNNGSFNCNAAKLIIQWRDWEHREALMDAVADALKSAPQRKAYYPGAARRYDSFMAAHPEGVAIGERSDDILPWTIIRDVDSSKSDEICFNTEAFCGVLSETALDADSPADFVAKAAQFCNERVWGTLNVCLLIHPKSLKDPEMAEAFDAALATLKYGTIGVNHWPALGYGLVSPTWGAFPGHALNDIQSGRGVVHNTYMFSKTQKSIVKGPFTMFPKPAWFYNNKNTHHLARRMADFERAPSVFKLPGIIAKALGG